MCECVGMFRYNCWLLVRAVACWLHDNYAAMRTQDDSRQTDELAGRKSFED